MSVTAFSPKAGPSTNWVPRGWATTPRPRCSTSSSSPMTSRTCSWWTAARSSAPAAARAAASAGHFFTPAQHAMVDELTETIIPADSHSGGAKAAKVADTIDRYLVETYDDSERSLWREGL